MRIKRVGIRNFRCLEEVEVDFDQITTFIGPNGAGKSTVLRALDWFFNGPKVSELTDDDCTFGTPFKNIVVQVEFCDLTAADRRELGSYVTVDSDRFIVWKYHESDGSEKMTSNARAFLPFESIRALDTAGKRKQEYKNLRERQPELKLPSATTDAAVSEAMRTWELEHPDQLEEAEQTVTNFFGFNSQSKMAGLFDFVLVTADLRASEEAQDNRATVIGRILERTIRRADADAEIAALHERVKEEQQGIYSKHFTEQLDAISQGLTDVVSQYMIGRSVKVSAAEAPAKPPKTQFAITILDNAIETSITHQGHGFQRAMLISSLQLLASHDSGQNEGTICLAIEEPELFQHPVQAQAFAEVLRRLAEDPAQRVQVTYATHSPYFLSPGHFNEIRRVTRPVSKDQQRAPIVRITATSVQQIEQQLAAYLDPQKVRTQLDGICINSLSDALFANAVVLVEGTTDRAVLEGSTIRKGRSPLSTAGIVIANVGGKDNLLLPHAILKGLDIPCYVVFDGDKGCGARMANVGRSRPEIFTAENNIKQSNRKLLRYLGLTEADWPATDINDNLAIIEDTLEVMLESDWPEWIEERDRIVSAGLGDPKKNSLLYRQAARDAAADPPPFLEELLAAVRQFGS